MRATMNSARYTERRHELWRVDWRFLLPVSAAQPINRLLLVGGTPSLAAVLRELGIAAEVVEWPADPAKVDAAIILHDAPLTPPAIVPRLRPGAIVYLEINRLHRPVYFYRLHRHCRQWNLTPTGIYAVSPHFEHPQLFLPLHAPWALEWYVHTLYDAKQLRQFLMERVLGYLTGLRANRFAYMAPYLAITGVAGRDRGLSRPPAGLPHEVWAPDRYPLLLTDGGNRVTLLPFSAKSRTPLRVIKIPKRHEFNNRTCNEQQVLENLRIRVSDEVRQSIPAPLGTLCIGNVIAGMESYLPGCSLLRRNGQWNASLPLQLTDFSLAVSWLIDFQQEGQLMEPEDRNQDPVNAVESLLATFTELFGVTELEERLFARMRQRARSLSHLKLPLVYVHRDYNVWNLYRDGHRLNVIDWEGGKPGLPLTDLLHFVTHWHETVQRVEGVEQQLEAFASLFIQQSSNTPYTAAVDAALVHYMKQMELAPGFLPLMLGVTWVELAIRRHVQRQDMGEESGDPRQGNNNFAFLALLGRRADSLFAGASDVG